jgi:hypothetical protein
MSIEVIRRMTCDWCGGDEETESVDTHTLGWDKRTVQIDVHATCEADASIEWLLDHGRKVDSNDKVTAPKPKVRCDMCGHVVTSMGRGMHTGKHKRNDNKTPTYTPEP